MKKLKFGACLPPFGSCADRYCLSGYGTNRTVPEMIALASKVKELKGIELVGNWHVNEKNFDEISVCLKNAGLAVSMMVPDLWTQAKWGKGSFTSKDASIRRAAADEVKKSMDMAARVGCDKVDVWLGQDGYDYAFQADYLEAWEQIIEGVRQCADHRKDVKICVEYKQKEPRTHIFTNNAPRTVLLVDTIGRDNVGILIDSGHSSAAQENPAEAVAMVNSGGRKRLFYIHINDNYGDWDDDMMFGSVHTIEALEMLYWLDRTGYDDYYTLDIFPYRENGLRAVEESIAWVNGLRGLLEKMGLDRIAEVIRKGDATESSRLLREAICK
ncbi:MAG: TIM barrel protein [Planctomycetes bacterium]|nr:TIM barrel protein [Planctomycetota bacterium]